MNRAWIFQANPTRFDVGGFIASGVSEIEWLVSGYRSEITPGDDVYLWRSAGDGAEPAGIYAAARTVSSVRVIPDDGPSSLWKDPAEALVPKHRARIALTRVAKKREFIKRDWWKDDPILRDHLIMRMAAQTTFPLKGEERRRFERIWSRTGADWTYADAVAGLHAYVLTQGKEVSKLPGSPVADVSLLIGRPVAGTYNKVMNFRAIDPRDARAGLAGASVQDRAVWTQFYDPAIGLHEGEVHAEFRRLWTPDEVAAEDDEVRRVCEAEADRLSAHLTLEELLALWQKRKAGRPGKPRVNLGQSRVFDRNPLVVAIARERAGWRCEVPGCAVPLFLDKDGVRFVEVHHIQTLTSGGDDTPENVACLCPLHHREAHFGRAAADLAEALRSVRVNGTR